MAQDRLRIYSLLERIFEYPIETIFKYVLFKSDSELGITYWNRSHEGYKDTKFSRQLALKLRIVDQDRTDQSNTLFETRRRRRRDQSLTTGFRRREVSLIDLVDKVEPPRQS